MSDIISLRCPVGGDGPAMKQIARDTGVLSVNSTYYYAMMIRLFSATCLIGQNRDKVCAYVTSFFLPERPDTLFIWQIGVARTVQGKGAGRQMLISLVEKNRPDFMEATIAPDNTASINVFKSMARHFDSVVAFSSAPFFSTKDLGPDEKPENLMRIGPIRHKS